MLICCVSPSVTAVSWFSHLMTRVLADMGNHRFLRSKGECRRGDNKEVIGAGRKSSCARMKERAAALRNKYNYQNDELRHGIIPKPTVSWKPSGDEAEKWHCVFTMQDRGRNLLNCGSGVFDKCWSCKSVDLLTSRWLCRRRLHNVEMSVCKLTRRDARAS